MQLTIRETAQYRSRYRYATARRFAPHAFHNLDTAPLIAICRTMRARPTLSSRERSTRRVDDGSEHNPAKAIVARREGHRESERGRMPAALSCERRSERDRLRSIGIGSASLSGLGVCSRHHTARAQGRRSQLRQPWPIMPPTKGILVVPIATVSQVKGTTALKPPAAQRTALGRHDEIRPRSVFSFCYLPLAAQPISLPRLRADARLS